MIETRRNRGASPANSIPGRTRTVFHGRASGTSANTHFLEDGDKGYDVEKWGTPEEWDKAINSIPTKDLSSMDTNRIQQIVQDRRLAAQQGHNEARK
jgi:hypothetical protein